jgi:hypothetical protein
MCKRCRGVWRRCTSERFAGGRVYFLSRQELGAAFALLGRSTKVIEWNILLVISGIASRDAIFIVIEPKGARSRFYSLRFLSNLGATIRYKVAIQTFLACNGWQYNLMKDAISTLSIVFMRLLTSSQFPLDSDFTGCVQEGIASAISPSKSSTG